MKQCRLLSLLATVAAGVVANAQVGPVPYNMDFEPPTYVPGVLYNGVTGQGPWSGGGGYTVQSANNVYNGSQSLRFNSSLFTSGNAFSGFAKFTDTIPGIFGSNVGTFVLQTRMKLTQAASPSGKVAWEIALWGTSSATSASSNVPLARLGFNENGVCTVRHGGNTAFPNISQAGANTPFNPYDWNWGIVTYEWSTRKVRAWINGAPVADGASIPIEVTIPGTAAAFFSCNEFDIQMLRAGTSGSFPTYGGVAGTPFANSDLYLDFMRGDNLKSPRTILSRVIMNDINSVRSTTGTPVVVELYAPSGTAPVETINTTLDDMRFFTAVPATSGVGLYDIRVKPQGWLSKRINGVDLADVGVFNLEFTCITGDVDNDDEIGAGDFDAITAAFGNSDVNLPEDVDYDGEVGSSDFDWVVAHFGEAGS